MKRTFLLSCLCCLIVFAAPAQDKHKNSYVAYLKELRKLYRGNIRVLNFDCNVPSGAMHSFFSADKNGKISSTAKNLHFVRKDERKVINEIILDKKCYRNRSGYLVDGFGCFNPRMGVLFYSKDSTTLLACIDICLECHSLEFRNYQKKGYYAISIFDYGLQQMSGLCKSLGLACCGKEN